jgi:4-hydroxy-tetrahydrodipicolinate synthase
MKLEGSMTAIVTPFAEQEVDYDALSRLIEYQIDGATQAIVPCGTTGESPTLSHEEHEKVIDYTVEKVAGRVPVIAGTGSNCTAEAVKMTKHAKQSGADACLIVNPYYNKPPQRGMFDHITAIAEAELPIVLYNIPGRTGIEMTPETIAEMYDKIEMVVAIKDATGKTESASAIASMCDITILSGDDSMTLPFASVGGRGVISVLANILPGEVRKLCDHILGNDFEAARQQHLRLLPLFKGIFCETNPIPIKGMMEMAGLCSGDVRLPLARLADQYKDKLAGLLKEFGVETK